MNFSATIRQASEVSIVDRTEHLNLICIARHRRRANEAKRKKIVLNVDGLVYLDSSGVGELVNCYLGAIKQGGETKVVGLTAKVEEILKITQLYRVIQEFHNEEAALRSFPEAKKKQSA